MTIRPRMPVYEGDPGVAIELARSMDRGDPANVSLLELGAHTGTHVDAPCHFIPDGGGADELSLDHFVGPCVVAELTTLDDAIDARCVASLQIPTGSERLLMKTPNSRLWEQDSFVRDFVRLDASGANALIERGLRLVGIDYLSIGDPAAHLALLSHGVAVVEGLDLRRVNPGRYVLACLPLKIGGCDGAPARAVLWPEIG